MGICPGVAEPPVADALAEVTRRYLAAYAPALREDPARWWGGNALSAAKAQTRFEALGDEAVEVRASAASAPGPSRTTSHR